MISPRKWFAKLPRLVVTLAAMASAANVNVDLAVTRLSGHRAASCEAEDLAVVLETCPALEAVLAPWALMPMAVSDGMRARHTWSLWPVANIVQGEAVEDMDEALPT